MSEGRKQIRFGHCEGYTDICYDDSGRYILSCGTDGDVRIWEGLQEDTPSSVSVAQCAHAVAFRDGRFFVGVETNSIHAYTFPDGQPDGIIARFTSPVTHIHCSSKSNLLVSGAGDFTIKVVDLKATSQKILHGHNAPILSVQLDPQEEFVASSSCDGSVRVWKLSDEHCVKTWNLLPKSNDFCLSKTLGRIRWFPNSGKNLVIPIDGEVQIYDRISWNLLFSLKDDFCSELISLVSFSASGMYLTTATSSGKIMVWNFKSQSCIEREIHEEGMICGLEWCPKGEDTLIYSDFHGQICMLTDIGKSDLDSETKKDEKFSALPDDEDDLTENFKLTGDSIEKTSESAKERDEDDEGVDIGAIKASYNSRIFVADSEDVAEDKKLIVEAESRTIVPELPRPVQQPPFQPGSTPAHLEHRFMVWNTVGLVRCYETDDESSIDVEFHDTTLHHALHISNTLGHTMADLSDEALLLACHSADDENSKVVCVHFGTWDSNKEWKTELPEGEEAEALTLGRGWAAVVTSKQFLRLFTIGGIQGSVISIPGPVVSISALEDVLILVYHRAAGLPGNQCLGLMRFNVKSQSILATSSSQPLPLSVKSNLVWLGFTDEGTPCTADSEGIIRLLIKGGGWIPVANTKSHTKGKSDHYFVIGLSEIQQQIRCIPCKGSRYPATLPHPSVCVLPFKLPLCDLSNDKGKFEEEYWRLENLNQLLKKLTQQNFEVDNELVDCEKKKVEVLLRMFALSTRNHKEFQAVEISQLMPNPQVIQGAIRYATQRHCITLAERLVEIAHQKLNEEMPTEDDDGPEEEDNYACHPAQMARHSLESNEPVIQPKSLTFTRHVSDDETYMEMVDDVAENSESGPEHPVMLNGLETNNKSSSHKNPFKVSSQHKKNAVGIDGILHDSMEQAAKRVEKLVTPQQQKLKAPKKSATNANKSMPPSTSGVQFYVQEMKAEIADENPELDKDDIVKLALQRFKQLSADEKQKWNQKANALKKRKPDTTEISNKKQKKEVSENTSLKLTQFMFNQKN